MQLLNKTQATIYGIFLMANTTQMFPELTSKTYEASSAQMANNHRLFES